MTMPFGKYYGWHLSELPNGYLDWLYGLDDLRPPLKKAVEREWNSRNGYAETEHDYFESPPPPPANGLATIDPPLFAELVQAGYRTLARKYHPDVGGNHDHMRRLNALMDWVRKKLPAA